MGVLTALRSNCVNPHPTDRVAFPPGWGWLHGVGRFRLSMMGAHDLSSPASVLVDDQALTLGHIFRTIVVPQVNMIIMLLPFPLMHMFYVARPGSIRSIFPSLSPLSHHIPLVCSWSTTSSILPHMTWILEVWSSYINTRQTLNVDKRVAALGPEFVRGWVSLLEARETTKKSKEENGDMGTRDKL